jgi:diguanylate cyclase (GGDEF)-like protein
MKKTIIGVSTFIWVLGLFVWVLPISGFSRGMKVASFFLWLLLGADLYLLYTLTRKENKEEDDNSDSITRYLVKLNTVWSEEHIFSALKEVLHSEFHYDKLVICRLFPQEPHSLKVIFTDGAGEHPGLGDNISIKDGLWAYVLRQKNTVFFSDYREKEPFAFRLSPGDLGHTPYQSLLGWSVQLDHFKSGVITMESLNPEEYSEKDLDIFNLISLNFASAYQRISTLDTLKRFATVDGLTGVLNHRAFKEKLFEEVYRARRYDHSLTLLMLDLDDFKKINDSYGHLYGDYMLRVVSDIIKNNIRMVDIVARYGGEEFTVILANAEKEAVLGTAERIRRKIAEFPFEQDGVRSSVTVSIGMASFPDDSHDGLSLIQAADDAMYKAKKAGKNRVQMIKTNNGGS